MIYQVSDILRDVRIAIDQNMSSEPLAEQGDVDTLSLEEIIESKIADAARIVESGAPQHLLDSGKAFGDNIGWDSAVGYGSGHILLPSDFLRLITFQMSDWSYAITTPITEDDPLYSRQHSRFPGIRGCPEKPVVAVVQQPVGLVLEFFSCTSGENAYIKRARYLPIPKIQDGTIELCEKLRQPIIYYTAYLTALSVGNSELATNMLNTSNELAK